MKKQLTNKEYQEYLKLQKQQQILYSWSWFYSNSKTGLFKSRYHKAMVKDEKRNGEIISYDISINDIWNTKYGKAIDYSQRFKEDKEKAETLSKEIRENQSLINTFYKKRN